VNYFEHSQNFTDKNKKYLIKYLYNIKKKLKLKAKLKTKTKKIKKHKNCKNFLLFFIKNKEYLMKLKSFLKINLIY
jgi:hypothetical protein